MLKDQDSEVSRFYENRSILITGAAGFIGKVLVQKLLWSCPGIKYIYILMREKRGMAPKKRFAELMCSEVFNGLKTEHPEAIKKLILVSGDIRFPCLGLSDFDIAAIIENVSIVFHSAASVRHDDHLRDAVDLNVLGTKRVLELCRMLQRFEALVHVSTAFSNCNRSEIEEKIYPLPMSPQNVIDMTRWLQPDLIETITPKLIGDRPNTYVFTKALAENLLAEDHGNLSVAIIRPSIVSASWKEPFPGWIDTLNASSGVILSIGKGLMRTFMGRPECVADVIPVDVVVNLMITIAWHTAIHRPNRIMVYNCTSESVNRTTWGDVLRCSIQYSLKYPSAEVFRYPHTVLRPSSLDHNIHVVFQHYVIAFLFDMINYVFCRKLRMAKLYQKMHKRLDGLQYYTLHEWKYLCDNVLMLGDLLSEEDKQKFFFDVKSLNWQIFWENHAIGLRKYLLKEDPFTIPAARKRLRRRYILSQIVQVAVFAAVLILCFRRSPLLNKLWYLASSAVLKGRI